MKVVALIKKIKKKELVYSKIVFYKKKKKN
jgi:hypothetical protein